MDISSMGRACGRAAGLSGLEAYGASDPGQDEAAALSKLTDGASLSSLAPRLKAVLDELASPDDNVLDALKENINRLQDGFIDRFYSVLSGQGVDLSTKLTLRLNSDALLTVAGEHPEKAGAEALLKEHPELSAAFAEIAAQSELLRDMRNIGKVMMSKGGIDSYARMAGEGSANGAVYQMSLKGEMSHFYFSAPR